MLRATCATLSMLLFACATNPARKLTPNDQDVEISPDGHFLRGNEHLDEEEFYDLVDDKTSAQKIHDDRALGELFQPVGIAVASVGSVLAFGGLLVYAGASKQKTDDARNVSQLGGYAGMGVGALGALGGGYLWLNGNDRASGKNLMFDQAHAVKSLEIARYGTGGATQSTVKSLELQTQTGFPGFCSIGTSALKPLVARDDKKRTIKLDHSRDDWFTWTINPPGTVTPDHSAVVTPFEHSLADLGKDVIINVKVNAPTNVSTQLVLHPDFACPKPWFNFEGGPGNPGAPGSQGNGAQGEGGAGSGGGQGVVGADGGSGGEVDVEATLISGPGGEPLVLAVIAGRGQKPTFAVFNARKAGQLLIDASGGLGGKGGPGGPGGNGWSYGSGDTCAQGGAGGPGGPGGNGGRGGSGGFVRVRADSKDALSAIAANVEGGRGGDGGNWGEGGPGGGGDSCKSDAPRNGAEGAHGAGGQGGGPGSRGKSDFAVAPRARLRLIEEALATMPGTSPPPGDAPPPPPPPPKKKKH